MKKIKKRTKPSDQPTKKSKPSPPLPATRPPQAILNPNYLLLPNHPENHQNLSQIIQNYQNRPENPFKFVALENFTEETVACQALEELKSEKWFMKRNDLYTFKQTDDLKNTKKTALREFRDSVYSSSFLDFLKKVTGVQLNSTIDLAGQHYTQGGNLLCHDDELDGRRIAFIWYLVDKSWDSSDGGLFCLYGNHNGQPTVEPVVKVTPKWNCVLFFETTPTTWHQVSEVLSKKDRYSIAGWFHGSILPRPEHFKEAPIEQIPVEKFPTGFKLEDFIDAKYLEKGAQESICKFFEKNSSIGLNDFLKQETYDQILAELEKAEWITEGPPNRRHYGSLGRTKGEREPPGVLLLKNFLRSKEMSEFIQKITGLQILSSEEGEVRRFYHTDYTLVHDNEHQHKSFGLDICLSFQDIKLQWEDEQGGFTTYMDEETELLALPPQPNVLCLVYRDVGCMKFVKYVTSTAPGPHYDITNTFQTLDTSGDDNEGEGDDDSGDDDSGDDDCEGKDEGPDNQDEGHQVAKEEE